MRAVGLSLPVALGAAVAIAVPATAVAASPVKLSAKPIATPLSGRASRTTVTVRNAGRGRLTGLTLTIGAAKGVKVTVAGARRGKLSRALKPLKPGQTARVRVTLRRAGRGPSSGRLTVRVTRRGKTLASTRLVFGGSGATKPGRPAEPVDPNSLAGRYFWGSTYTVGGIMQHTLWFTGPDYVFTDDTESAFPTCVAPSEQCKPYTYDARSNALTIDGKPATLQGRRIEFDGDSYAEFGFPAPGARWDTVVTYSNSSGLCPLFCSYFTENLTFMPDGNFIRDAVASGTGPVVDWASVPPDQKGTYEVRADHTLRLAFADGRERVETVALYLDDDGSLKPAGDGLLLGGDGYFDIRD